MDPGVRFGLFELDPRSGELRKAGVKVNFAEQPFQVLKTLLERPGELVTREELRQRLWAAETFVDFEHGLNAAVRRLRDALGDSADVPRFVETLPRRGYRFIAPVTVQRTGDVVGPSPSVVPSPPVVKPEREALAAVEVGPSSRVRPMWRPMLTAAIVVGSVIVLGVFGYLSWTRATRQPVQPTTASVSMGRFMVAVLPFENLTGDAEQEYIGDGMTDELIAQLGRMDPTHLGVIARTSVMQFKDTTKRADQIGSDLGVGYVVEASFRTTGNRIRIAVRLIDTQSDSQRWSEQYERDVKNLLTIQREVAEAISVQIATSLGVVRAPAGNDARRHSTIPEANEHYLRGRYHLFRETTGDYNKALTHFQSAIDLDNSYALAYSGLADAYVLLGSAGLRPMSEAYPLARAAALKALAIDDMLAEAHNSLAAILIDYYWEWSEGERHFQRALELDPNYGTALGFYSFFLSCRLRHDEALAFAERARRLDPVSPLAQMNVATVLYFARRYDEAIAEIADVLDLAPDFGQARILLGRIYVAKGMPDQAIHELERAEALMGPRPDVTTPHAYVLARAGRRREALSMLDELRRRSKPRAPAPIRVAMVHVGLADTDRAFEWLEKAFEARDWQMALLNVEPAFDDLRSDQRFPDLVDRVGLSR